MVDDQTMFSINYILMRTNNDEVINDGSLEFRIHLTRILKNDQAVLILKEKLKEMSDETIRIS